MKIYISFMAVLLVAVLLGFAVPILISAKDTLMTVAGFALLASSPFIIYHLIKWALKP